jgi:hypothetical protein
VHIYSKLILLEALIVGRHFGRRRLRDISDSLSTIFWGVLPRAASAAWPFSIARTIWIVAIDVAIIAAVGFVVLMFSAGGMWG